MSEALGVMHGLRQSLMGMLGRGAADAEAATPQGLPVNLGGYEFAKNSPAAAARLYGVDQALIWVVVALLMWGMVMVYSASIAMPDNPRFARYAQTHVLTRHVLSLGLGGITGHGDFAQETGVLLPLDGWLWPLHRMLVVYLERPSGVTRDSVRPVTAAVSAEP